MKKIFITIAAIIITAILSADTFAQVADKQEFKVPLSNPGQPGTLKAGLHRGSIKVTGYSGNEVLVTVINRVGKEDDREASRSGLRRIPNTAVEFNITEENNFVRIQGVHNKMVNFEVKVPNNFSLILNTHHNGYIEVNDVTGEIEAQAHHDDIILNNIGGSATANTHHGEIKATFNSVTPNTPMAFSTYHGDIDITFPSEVNGSAKIKTTKGDIFTDFDIVMKAQSARIESRNSKGTKIRVGGWLIGEIGNGGGGIYIQYLWRRCDIKEKMTQAAFNFCLFFVSFLHENMECSYPFRLSCMPGNDKRTSPWQIRNFESCKATFP